MGDNDLIAVIGMSARMPKADNIEEYWRNLADGLECMTDLPKEDILARGELPERLRHPSYVRRRPMLRDIELFDAKFFGMTPREAEIRDPQHRLFLEACFGALENAGYDSRAYPGSIGLFGGVNATHYPDLHIRQHPDLVRAVGELVIETGNNPDYVTTFAAYKLGLRGPTMTIATACSTSLVAIHVGCQALRAGECHMALAGGVEVEWPYGVGYLHVSGSIMSPDGMCRPFDKDAAGTVFGSGVGAVLLKRYTDALADGDNILAVVRGSAVNNDGSDKVAFTAPSVSGQVSCIRDALLTSATDPRSITYLEAHGTATKIGDPIEVASLTEAFRTAGGGTESGYCGIGSVKSNVGHLGPAAGVAAFIKTVLALDRELIPPSINFREPNPLLNLDATPFRVVEAAERWPRGAKPRRAGVSSFGIGGTNAHVILEEAPVVSRPAQVAGRPELITVSATTAAGLAAAAEDLAGYLASAAPRLDDVSYTLRNGRAAYAVRRALVAVGTEQAADFLRRDSDDSSDDRPEVVLAMPGQGTQFAAMGAELVAQVPGIRDSFDTSVAAFSDELHIDLRRVWSAPEDAAELAATVVTQPLLFSLQYAIATELLRLGLRPLAMIGHSLGEITAGAVAGVWSYADAIRLIAARAQAMQAVPGGAMIAVAADEVAVASFADGSDVWVAALNSRKQSVLSARETAVGRLTSRLEAEKIQWRRLDTTHPYHSGMMRPAADEFLKAFDGVVARPPAIPILSCASAAPETTRCVEPEFWAGQLTAPVRFAAAGDRLLLEYPRSLVVEIGPGYTLTQLLKNSPRGRRARVRRVPLMSGSSAFGGELGSYLAGIGRLWTAGIDLDLGQAVASNGRRTSLPGYRFQRTRCFVDRPPAPVPTEQPVLPGSSDKGRVRLFVPSWRRCPWRPAVNEFDGKAGALTVLPHSRAHSRLVISAVAQAGLQPIRWWAPGTAPGDEAELDTTNRDAVFEAVRRLAGAGQLPRTVVHAAMVGDGLAAGTETARGLKAVLWLYQAMQRYRGEAGLRDWRMVILAQRAADVSGSEDIIPARAMIIGALKTMALETASFGYQMLDYSGRVVPDVLACAIQDEGTPVAAIRNGSIWTPVWEEIQVPNGIGRSSLRRRGTYVITGGTGALGLVAARALTDTGIRPKLALISRSGTDRPGTEAATEAMIATGADVMVLRADVADPGELGAALHEVRTRFGPVHGVVHAAGVAGDGLLELRSEPAIDAVLRPKVIGASLLHDAVAGDDIDFIVHFGSRAAASGLVGSGDYAAANAFLDALAASDGVPGRNTVSIAWPGWAGDGMVARGSAPRPSAEETIVERSLTGQEWYLAEHLINGVPVLPGAAYFDLILSAAAGAGLLDLTACAEIRSISFLRPLIVATPVTLWLRFSPRPDGRHAVTAETRGTEITVHATAIVGTCTEPPSTVDLSELTNRGRDEPVKSDGLGLVTFGPRWNNLRRVTRVDESLVLELSLPEQARDDVPRHRVHAALLDVATAIVQNDPAESQLPFGYDALRTFRPIPADVAAVVTPASRGDGLCVANVRLYDARGRLVTAVDGFTMRRVNVTDLLSQVAASAVGPAAARQLLTPSAGAEILLTAISLVGVPNLTVVPPGADAPGSAAPPDPAPSSAPPRAIATSDNTLDQPGQTVETRMAELWHEVLGETGIDANADFFDVGGDSLAAVQLVARIRDTFDVELGVGAVFEASTIRLLATELTRLAAR